MNISFAPASRLLPALRAAVAPACVALMAFATLPAAHANDSQVLLGGGVGAAAGAILGQKVGGNTGAVIGGAIGGATGAAATSHGPRQNGAILGGAVGGAAGAVVGQSVGGRTGAVIGAGAGGAVGASMGRGNGGHEGPQQVVRYDRGEHYGYDRRGAYEARWSHEHERNFRHGHRGHGWGHDRHDRRDQHGHRGRD